MKARKIVFKGPGFVQKSKHCINDFKFTPFVEYLILVLTVITRPILVNWCGSGGHFSGWRSFLKKIKKSGKIMFASASVTRVEDIIIT